MTSGDLNAVADALWAQGPLSIAIDAGHKVGREEKEMEMEWWWRWRGDGDEWIGVCHIYSMQYFLVSINLSY